MRKSFRGRTLVRASMLLPWVAPVVAVAFTWQVLLSPQFGLVNSLGEQILGWKDPVPFLSQSSTALWTVIGSLPGVVATITTPPCFDSSA